MTMRDGFWSSLLRRIEAAMGSFLVTRIQRRLLQQSVDDSADLERQARDLDSANMPELAAMLREQAAGIRPDDPCRAGTVMIENVTATSASPDVPMIVDEGRTKRESEQAGSQPVARRTGRRTRRTGTDKK